MAEEDCKMKNSSEAAENKRNNDLMLPDAKRRKIGLVSKVETLISDQQNHSHINMEYKCKDALSPRSKMWKDVVIDWGDSIIVEEVPNKIPDDPIYLQSSDCYLQTEHIEEQNHLFGVIENLQEESKKQAEIPLSLFLKDLGLEELLEKFESRKIGVNALKKFNCEDLKALNLPVVARNTLRFVLRSM